MAETSAVPRIIPSPPSMISVSTLPLRRCTLCESEEDWPARVSSKSYIDQSRAKRHEKNSVSNENIGRPAVVDPLALTQAGSSRYDNRSSDVREEISSYHCHISAGFPQSTSTCGSAGSALRAATPRL